MRHGPRAVEPDQWSNRAEQSDESERPDEPGVDATGPVTPLGAARDARSAGARQRVRGTEEDVARFPHRPAGLLGDVSPRALGEANDVHVEFLLAERAVPPRSHPRPVRPRGTGCARLRVVRDDGVGVRRVHPVALDLVWLGGRSDVPSGPCGPAGTVRLRRRTRGVPRPPASPTAEPPRYAPPGSRAAP